MNMLHSWPIKLVGSAICSALLAGVLLVALGASRVSPSAINGAASNTLSIRAASPQQLAVGGLTLTQPVNENASIGRETAIRIAEDAFPDVVRMGGVRDVVLAHMSDRLRSAPYSRLTWVVDLSPPNGLPIPGGPVGSKPARASWFLVFVDAQTGAIDLAESGG